MVLRWDVFRVVALVAAGVASGYLWRAALEEPRLETVFPVGSTSEPLPDWLQPRLQPPTLERVRGGPRHVARRRLRPPERRPRAAPASRTRIDRSQSVLAAATSADPPTTPQPRKQPPQRPRRQSKPPKTQRPSPRSTPPAPPPPPPPPSPPPPTPAAPPPAKPVPPPPPADRPGWGKGDPNHNHTGPPGRGKR